ncbi:COX15/CtaA family protein [Nesterenkonia marinintestina]|uniref:COX15/CtaA family protein n=1 Tax=Nesterenkonia marinintestina TaxID=2979865 RepID=UPI0021C19B7C|nr:COX15/CtaA family protein [Nesterenkonia sp. GX14115]
MAMNSPAPRSSDTARSADRTGGLLGAVMPDRITRWTRLIALLTLISNTGIILTGGAVRLTASGLGCPEWPRCTPESWTSTQEMGMHGAIEFGNRLLTFVLVVISILMFLAVVRLWTSHRSLVVMTLLVVAGIPVQALIGGVTVWTDLNPWVVGLHFIVSAGLVMVATMLLARVSLELRAGGRTGVPLVDGETDAVSRSMASAVLLTAAAAVILGTIVTGTGPHAGDPIAPRHEFTPELVTRLHVVPVWVLCAALVVLVLRQIRLRTSSRQRSAVLLTVLAVVAQGVIGYVQHFTGLPLLLVWLHMLGSALVVITATMVWDRYRAGYTTRGLDGAAAAPRTTATYAPHGSGD